jgi:hypothetical protein
MFATVWMPELPDDSALVDGVSLGESVGVGAGVSVGPALGESVGLGSPVAGAAGVAGAWEESEQVLLGDGLADPVSPPLGTTTGGELCPFRVGP